MNTEDRTKLSERLTSFSSALPALTTWASMFSGYELNKESTLRILNTIPAATSGTRDIFLDMAADEAYNITPSPEITA